MSSSTFGYLAVGAGSPDRGAIALLTCCLFAAIGGVSGYLLSGMQSKEQWRNIMILTGPPGAGKGSQVTQN